MYVLVKVPYLAWSWRDKTFDTNGVTLFDEISGAILCLLKRFKHHNGFVVYV